MLHCALFRPKAAEHPRQLPEDRLGADTAGVTGVGGTVGVGAQ